MCSRIRPVVLLSSLLSLSLLVACQHNGPSPLEPTDGPTDSSPDSITEEDVTSKQSGTPGQTPSAASPSVAASNLPPTTGNAKVTFRSKSCACVEGTIHNFVDGSHVGSMACRQQRSYTVTVGAHDLEARDDTGYWGPRSVNARKGKNVALVLACS